MRLSGLVLVHLCCYFLVDLVFQAIFVWLQVQRVKEAKKCILVPFEAVLGMEWISMHGAKWLDEIKDLKKLGMCQGKEENKLRTKEDKETIKNEERLVKLALSCRYLS